MGKSVGFWRGCAFRVRKKDFELLNCGLPWTEVQAKKMLE